MRVGSFVLVDSGRGRSRLTRRGSRPPTPTPTRFLQTEEIPFPSFLSSLRVGLGPSVGKEEEGKSFLSVYFCTKIFIEVGVD